MDFYDDDYFEPNSKYEALITETVEKIKKGIKKDIKNDLKEALSWKEKYSKLEEQFFDLDCEKAKLIEKNKDLESKLIKKQGHKYDIGDEVFIVVRDTSVSKTYKCPTCEGKGKVKAKDFDENFPFDIEIECPVCRNRAPGCNYKDEKYGNSYRTEYTYEGRTVHKGLITGINLTTDNSYLYQIKSLVWNTYSWYKDDEVFLTKELAREKVKEYTSNRENEIAKYIGPKWEKESK